MRSKKIKKVIFNLSEGVLKNITDIILFQIFYGINLVGQPYSTRGAWRASLEAEKALEEINYETLKRSFLYLVRKGFLRLPKEKKSLPELTALGRKRLNAILPSYDEHRPWDGKLYLITYDIPENQKVVREEFRFLLRQLGCGRLQKSLWINPYNPQKVLESFIEKRRIKGLVIISILGEDGYVGGESIKTLISHVYKLEELNLHYLKFIKTFKKTASRKELAEKIFTYLSILKDDPQLPFSLLPSDWKGEQACKLFKRIHTLL